MTGMTLVYRLEEYLENVKKELVSKRKKYRSEEFVEGYVRRFNDASSKALFFLLKYYLK